MHWNMFLTGIRTKKCDKAVERMSYALKYVLDQCKMTEMYERAVEALP